MVKHFEVHSSEIISWAGGNRDKSSLDSGPYHSIIEWKNEILHPPVFNVTLFFFWVDPQSRELFSLCSVSLEPETLCICHLVCEKADNVNSNHHFVSQINSFGFCFLATSLKASGLITVQILHFQRYLDLTGSLQSCM